MHGDLEMNAPLTPNPKSVPIPDDFGQQVGALRADLMALAETITNGVSEGVGKAGRQIGRTGRDARAIATNAVVGHPLAAIGIAMGLLVLVGLLVRKR
jgi:ElaB/YqjD/DUF883 family membrane-anchored ribosome-binding protein